MTAVQDECIFTTELNDYENFCHPYQDCYNCSVHPFCIWKNNKCININTNTNNYYNEEISIPNTLG